MGKPTLCIVGLGYVGMPLAHAFAKAKYSVYGFDVDELRITELKNSEDRTNELTEKELKKIKIEFSTDPAVIGRADIVILAIPTPVDAENKPDLNPLFDATRTVGKNLKKGAIIVYESTVYPGITEEKCAWHLEHPEGDGKQKHKRGEDFFLGYSPERVNPGDKEHTIDKIMKIVAGQDKETTDKLVELYGSIVKAGIHKAPSIKVAEMAKAIENAQRDINIAYINEIAKFCNKLGIETRDVLDAAKTKWNFLPFTPGLVGGHCIGVDPYYLMDLAREKHLLVKLIKTARETNDSISEYISNLIFSALKNGKGSEILILGLTFKENVPDDRNSKAREVISILKSKGCSITAHDPYKTPEQNLTGSFDAIVLLVPHKQYREMSPADFKKLAKSPCLFYDLKSVFGRKEIEDAGFTYMAL